MPLTFHIVKVCLLVASAVATIDAIMVHSTAYVLEPRLLMASWILAATVFWIAGLAAACVMWVAAILSPRSEPRDASLSAMVSSSAIIVAYHLARGRSLQASSAQLVVTGLVVATVAIAVFQFVRSAEDRQLPNRLVLRALLLGEAVAVYWLVSSSLRSGPMWRVAQDDTVNTLGIQGSPIDPIPVIVAFVLFDLLAGGVLLASGLFLAGRMRNPRLLTAAAGVMVSAALLVATGNYFAPGQAVLRREMSGASPADTSAAPSDVSLPNVILVVLDTVAAGHMSLYGYDRPTTPNIDRFASSAHVFDRAYAPSSWTLPSHASMLTGLMPSEHRAHRIGTIVGDSDPTSGLTVRFGSRPLAEDFPTVAEQLGQRGYETALIVANHAYFASYFGMLRGFEYVDNRAMNILTLESIAAPFARRLGPAVDRPYRQWSAAVHSADTIFRHLGDWLGERGDRPFFLLLNFMDAHGPYLSAERPIRSAEATRLAPAPDVRPLVDRYDRSIFYLDHHIGRLLDDLRERGLYEESLIIVTADHGETFDADSPTGYHGRSLADSEVHVPLLVKLPGQSTGERWGDPVSLVQLRDLMIAAADGSWRAPRNAGTMGTPPAAGPLAEPERGVTAETFLAGSWGAGDRTFTSLDELEAEFPSIWAMVSPGWKLVRFSTGREELFDLWTGPEEARDRLSENGAAVTELEHRLTEIYGDGLRAPLVLAGLSSPDDEVMTRLRALGYVR